MDELSGYLRTTFRIGEGRIGLDIDSVVADVITPLKDTYNKRHGTNYTLDGADNTPRWGRDGPGAAMNREEFLGIYSELWMKQLPGLLLNPELLEEAATYYLIDVVTARSDDTVPPLKIWLSNNRVSGFEELISAPGIDKSELPHRLNIDDDPKLAKKLDGMSEKFLLLTDIDYWNGSTAGENNIPNSANVLRVKNVNHGLELLIRHSEAEGIKPRRKVLG